MWHAATEISEDLYKAGIDSFCSKFTLIRAKAIRLRQMNPNAKKIGEA